MFVFRFILLTMALSVFRLNDFCLPLWYLRINFKFKFKRFYLQTVYFSFIRPIMQYGDIFWDNIPNYLKQSLEIIEELEAVRIITGGTQHSSTDSV